MNKRQRKKEQKKNNMFTASFVSSYRELKEIDRSYHEYMLHNKRLERIGKKHSLYEEWKKLGYTDNEAEELTRLSMIFI